MVHACRTLHVITYSISESQPCRLCFSTDEDEVIFVISRLSLLNVTFGTCQLHFPVPPRIPVQLQVCGLTRDVTRSRRQASLVNDK